MLLDGMHGGFTLRADRLPLYGYDQIATLAWKFSRNQYGFNAYARPAPVLAKGRLPAPRREAGCAAGTG